MVFVIEASYRREARRWTSKGNIFPTYETIAAGVQETFPTLDSFYLALVRFSSRPGGWGGSGSFIGHEFRSEKEWSGVAAPFAGRSYPNGILRFHVYDEETNQKSPATTPPPKLDDSQPGAAGITALAHVKLSIHTKSFYELEILDHPVGKGGFCDIFAGTHRPTGIKLALKRPRVSILDAADTLRRVQREVETWSTFDHPNVLPFLGVISIEPHTYLVSPWLEQGDLATFAGDRVVYFNEKEKGSASQDPRHKAYDEFDERRVIQGIAAGIAYLHSRAFVHGDLKGKNVLLGEGNMPLLCDFGMAKAMDSPSSNTSSAMKGVGTMRWQSPELFMGESKTLKSDVYAFAMVITEVLTGSFPLPALSSDFTFLNQVLYKHIRPSFDPTSRNGVDFTPLWEIAASCWAENPDDRPPIDEMLHRLELISAPKKI